MEQKTVQVDLNKMDSIRCGCGCPFFHKRTVIKRIPGLLVGAPTHQFMAIDFWACEDCGLGRPECSQNSIFVPGLTNILPPTEPTSEEAPSDPSVIPLHP